MSLPQRRQLPWREPADVARQLAAQHGETGLIWLDGDGSGLGRWVTLAAAPQATVTCRGRPGEAGAENPFTALRSLEPGHWTGWLSYEAAAWCEPGNPWAADGMASLWIARHDPLLRFDLQRRELWAEASDTTRLDALEQQLQQPRPSPAAVPCVALEDWQHHTDRAGFAAGVQRIRDLIAAGDLFQANLTACSSTTWPAQGSALELFIKLRERLRQRLCGSGAGGSRRGPALQALPNASSRWMQRAGCRPDRSKARGPGTRIRNGTPT